MRRTGRRLSEIVPSTRRGRVLILCLAVLAMLGAVPAVALGTTTAGTTLCGRNQHLLVHNAHGEAFYVRNPYWHGIGETCISNARGGANFTVRRVALPDGSGKVNGYPDILRGCIWLICTPHTNMPLRTRAVRSLHLTWHTRQGVPGIWNAATDIWFGKHRDGPDGRATRDGAELMIWLNSRHVGGHTDTAPVVKIDGIRWHFWHWHTCDRVSGTGACWNYVSYRMVQPRWKVDELNVKAFIQHAELHHLVRPDWWLQSVGAGFEIWRGGLGLATTQYNVSLRRK